ncbi:hypothetical protein RIF29_30645 [Crotalaria pallida]|uniref:Uncharacterized protein n=1 Tax=Crotalaria pallida TaxID=3830 RepID=A0AAN9I1C9_CROPI
MINIAQVDGYAELFVIHQVSQPFIDLDKDEEGGPAEGVGVGQSVDAGGVGVGQTVSAEGVGLDQGMSEGVGPGLCKGVGSGLEQGFSEGIGLGLGKDVEVENRSDEESVLETNKRPNNRSESSEDDDSQDEDAVIPDESATTETDDDDLNDEQNEDNGCNSDDSAMNIRTEAPNEAPRSAATEVAGEPEIQAKKKGIPKRNSTSSVKDKNNEEHQRRGADHRNHHSQLLIQGLSDSEYGSEELHSGGDSDEDNV